MAHATLGNFSTTEKFAREDVLLATLIADARISDALRNTITCRAVKLVRRIREEAQPSLMEHFLAEYGLSTHEGVALMCLAEAMLRVPDTVTMDALIEDKIAPSNWGAHMGEAASSLVNASTWALMLTGRVLDRDQPGIAGVLHGAIKRLGEPVVRTAVRQAMKEMGRQFVLGETIDKALKRAAHQEEQGYTYSYDMLGEAAVTVQDAKRYAASYASAIESIAGACTQTQIEDNPGISVKLSALHPRYEVAQEKRVMAELVPVVLDLARKAKAAGMGFNIDAEEQARLVLSLKVIAAVLTHDDLAGWDGFGVVVQAYGKRAPKVIDELYALAKQADRKIMVRLVKGAYWDTEMKLAQVEGLADFSLFTSKAATDVSYIVCATKLFGYADRIYPQFATHNAHTVAAVLELANGRPFEFQRLHGMGERLHDIVLHDTKGRCRIYAPVGAHRDLLAYLVRRLLENGANSSFVHQIVNECVSPETIAEDPFRALASAKAPRSLVKPKDLYGKARVNAKGFDLSDEGTLAEIELVRKLDLPNGVPLTVSEPSGTQLSVTNPATGEVVAHAIEADTKTVNQAIADAQPWASPVSERAQVLRRAADLYETNAGLIFAAVAREAGKSIPDTVGELREAVDFLRYYADQAQYAAPTPLGIVSAISPWNFPLAIFTGQIAAALATGNAVLAKPAEQTPVIATIAVRLLHQAGVPTSALQLLPGQGQTVGAALTSDARISAVIFTGSTQTARIIRQSMADHMNPSAPLIAETGGLNAMIVDSTALPEQAVRDVVASAFQSAGQRCSALRCLYVQEEIAHEIIEMIKGTMDELTVGDPWALSTDIGPVIDNEAYTNITAYITQAKAQGRVLHQCSAPHQGHFIAPALIQVAGIEALEHEIFGPVLHVATFKGPDINHVVGAINAKGFGLTFGLHTRIDRRVQDMAGAIHVGNLYVNRNQIGAVVGSQPFGGEGLSGTGPKAGGPLYLQRLCKPKAGPACGEWDRPCDGNRLQSSLLQISTSHLINQLELPGPTGEDNTLSQWSRGPILCLGPGKEAANAQAYAVRALGGVAVTVDGRLAPEQLKTLENIHAVIWWGNAAEAYAKALAARKGPIVPLITHMPDLGHVVHERHLCVDTTASGGNAILLAGH